MAIVLYCIVSIHLYSASCSAHQSEALTVRETQREESKILLIFIYYEGYLLIECNTNFHTSIQVNGSDKLLKIQAECTGKTEKISQCRSSFLDSQYFSGFLNIVSVSVS